MKLLIIEDEQPALKRILRLVHELAPQAVVLGTADSISSGVKLFKEFPEANLALMDIELADGQSFEIFRQVQVTIPIIFTTAYDEYALKAFKVNSIDYLLKPIDPEELKQALQKFERLKEPNPTLNFNELINSLNQKTTVPFKQRFLVKLGQKLISVPVTDSAYFHAADKLVYLISKDGKRLVVDHTLDELEGMLDPMNFFRLNRQFLCSLSAIESISTYFNGKLKIHIKPGVEEEVLVSRERAAEFKQWLNQ